MPYWRLFYHIIWSTKSQEPILKVEWEQKLYGYLWGKATALGCIPHAINGMEDHIHVAISIPPSQTISRIVAQLKGSSSHYVNSMLRAADKFQWQSEYGLVSFSENDLPNVIKYVREQNNHHRAGSTNSLYERLV